jgi:hypothetical protein
MAYEEVWGLNRLIEAEICFDCDEFPCICGDWTDEAADMEFEAESEDDL